MGGCLITSTSAGTENPVITLESYKTKGESEIDII